MLNRSSNLTPDEWNQIANEHIRLRSYLRYFQCYMCRRYGVSTNVYKTFKKLNDWFFEVNGDLDNQLYRDFGNLNGILPGYGIKLDDLFHRYEKKICDAYHDDKYNKRKTNNVPIGKKQLIKQVYIELCEHIKRVDFFLSSKNRTWMNYYISKLKDISEKIEVE